MEQREVERDGRTVTIRRTDDDTWVIVDPRTGDDAVRVTAGDGGFEAERLGGLADDHADFAACKAGCAAAASGKGADAGWDYAGCLALCFTIL